MPYIAEYQREFHHRQTRNITLGFIALAGVIVSAAFLSAVNERQIVWVTHTYQVRRQISEINLALARLEAIDLRDARGPQNDRAVQSGEANRIRLEAAIAEFGRLTADNPRQQARVPLLQGLERQALIEAGFLPRAQGGRMRRVDRPLESFEKLARVMQYEEARLLKTRIERMQDIQLGFYVALGLTATLLCALGALIYASLWKFTQEIIASRQALHEANIGLEMAVQERTVDLKRANGELQRFAYIVSHDLRSPLVNVMGFTAELETSTQKLAAMLQEARRTRPETIFPESEELIEQDLPEAIHFIRASTRKMDRLINVILQLSRQNSRQLMPQWLDMNKLLAEIVENMRVLADQAGARIIIDPGQPEIYGDRILIEQILSNLIENAVKYGEPGRDPVVEVTARRVGEFAEFCVTDNGRGIDRRDFDRIFELFRRSGPQNRPGEGIGLAHVRTLIYRLGGSIKVESELGVGSTFTVCVPVYYSEEKSQVL